MPEIMPQRGDPMLDLRGRPKVVDDCDGKATGGGWVVWTQETAPDISRPYKVRWHKVRKQWEAFDGKY